MVKPSRSAIAGTRQPIIPRSPTRPGPPPDRGPRTRRRMPRARMSASQIDATSTARPAVLSKWAVGDQPFEPHRLRPVPQTSRAPRTTPAASPAARTRKHRSARLTCPLRRLPPVPCDPIGLSIRIPSPAASASPLTNVTRGWAPYKCRAMGSALFPLDRGGKGRCTIGAVAAEGEKHPT